MHQKPSLKKSYFLTLSNRISGNNPLSYPLFCLRHIFFRIFFVTKNIFVGLNFHLKIMKQKTTKNFTFFFDNINVKISTINGIFANFYAHFR